MKMLDEVLDEVIESITKWSGLEIRNVNKPDKDRFWVDRETYMDALHYLRNYRENQHAYEEGNRKAEEARERYLEAVKNCELAENKYKRLCKGTSQNFADTSQKITCPQCHSEFVILPEANNALIWQELTQMKGKPVWVENQFYKRWLIAYKVNREDITFDGNGFYTQAFSDDYGKAWQAYRKENV